GLAPALAVNVGNYTLNSGLIPLAAELSCDGSRVLLKTSRLDEGANYTVTVKNLQDTRGNVIVTGEGDHASFRFESLLRGLMKREVFSHLAGGSLADLTNAAVFPLCPTRLDHVGSFEAASQI